MFIDKLILKPLYKSLINEYNLTNALNPTPSTCNIKVWLCRISSAFHKDQFDQELDYERYWNHHGFF